MVTFKWSRKIHQIYDIINTWKVRKMQYDKSFKARFNIDVRIKSEGAFK